MKIFAENLRKTIESTHFDEVQRITCSFGIAEATIDDTKDSLLNRADRALYRAKENGRNRVEIEKTL